ncbi:PREDICTED: uncharacterized PE-PGRS family protein PE_PGRS46-like isoform X3 [Corvus brachyrhynchos]|uniref:uncharacterized PE-PGRS family protein PE_PGRS46-like isoform X3 n=1 Tax=Corvus brachyrhynchos TaxID=85066 RepID=UPI0008165D2A|nr:PREDICTED: uncharacterized PE-PGRS family protein PE_PGRS46-like isoform X3 [Corvus brachyrhynchos]
MGAFRDRWGWECREKELGIAGNGSLGTAPSWQEWEGFWDRWGWEWLLPGRNGRDSGVAGDGNGSFPAGMGEILGSLGMGMAPSRQEWERFWGRWGWEWLLPGRNGRDSGVAGDGNGSFPAGMGEILGSLGMGMAPSRQEWERFWGRWGWEWLLPGRNGRDSGVAGDGNGSFPAGMGEILGSLGMGMAPSRQEWERFWGRWGWEWLLPGRNGRDSGVAGDGNGSFPAGMGEILGSLGMGMAPSRQEWERFWGRWGWEWLLPGRNGRDSGVAGDGNGSFPAGMGEILGSLGMGMAPSRQEWERFWGRWGWEWLLPGRNGRDSGVAGDGNGSFPAGMGEILGSLGMGMAPSRQEWERFWGRWGWEWLLPGRNGRDSGVAGDGNGSFPAGMGEILGSLGMGMAPSRQEWERFWGRWGWEWLLPGRNGRDSGVAGDGNGSFPAGMGEILGSLGMGMAPSRQEWERFWGRWGWEWLLPGRNGRDSGVAGDGNGSFPAGMGEILGSLGMGMAPSRQEWERFWGRWGWEWLLPGRNGRDSGVAGDGNGSFPAGMGEILGSLGMGMAPSRQEWERFWGRWGWEWLLPGRNGRDSGVAGDGNGSFPAGMGEILGSLGMGMAPSRQEWERFWGRWGWEWLLPGGNGRDFGVTGDGNAGKRGWEWLLGNGSLGMAPSWWEWGGFWGHRRWGQLGMQRKGAGNCWQTVGNGSFPAGLGGILGSLELGMAPSWEGFWGHWEMGMQGKRSRELLEMALWEWLVPSWKGRDSGIAGAGESWEYREKELGISGNGSLGMAPSWRDWEGFWDHRRWGKLRMQGIHGKLSMIPKQLGMAHSQLEWEGFWDHWRWGQLGMQGILGKLSPKQLGMVCSQLEWEGFWDHWSWECREKELGIVGNGSFPTGMGGILGSLEVGTAGNAENSWETQHDPKAVGNGLFPTGMGGILGSLELGMAPSWLEWEGFWDHQSWGQLGMQGKGAGNCWQTVGNGSFPVGIGLAWKH